MPDLEPGQGDAEGLTRKLRDLESQLTARERLLLKRILTAAVLSGIIGGAVDTGLGRPGASPAPTVAAEGMEGIRAQFAAAFTPGEEFGPTLPDIGLVC